MKEKALTIFLPKGANNVRENIVKMVLLSAACREAIIMVTTKHKLGTLLRYLM